MNPRAKLALCFEWVSYHSGYRFAVVAQGEMGIKNPRLFLPRMTNIWMKLWNGFQISLPAILPHIFQIRPQPPHAPTFTRCIEFQQKSSILHCTDLVHDEFRREFLLCTDGREGLSIATRAWEKCIIIKKQLRCKEVGLIFHLISADGKIAGSDGALAELVLVQEDMAELMGSDDALDFLRECIVDDDEVGAEDILRVAKGGFVVGRKAHNNAEVL